MEDEAICATRERIMKLIEDLAYELGTIIDKLPEEYRKEMIALICTKFFGFTDDFYALLDKAFGSTNNDS